MATWLVAGWFVAELVLLGRGVFVATRVGLGAVLLACAVVVASTGLGSACVGSFGSGVALGGMVAVARSRPTKLTPSESTACGKGGNSSGTKLVSPGKGVTLRNNWSRAASSTIATSS